MAMQCSGSVGRHPVSRLSRRLFWSFLLFTLLRPLPTLAVQSQIVLRNLQIPASSVDRFDASAVYLADSTIVHWDDVLKAKLAEPGSVNEADLARQNSFDAILASRGQPLFQVRHRLALGDWLSLAEVAEPLYRELKAFPESPEMARQEYLISLGTLYARLSRGDRAGAVPPFLRACRYPLKNI